MISAYSDNAAVIEGWRRSQTGAAAPATTASSRTADEPIHILMKVETHNHPTAISPFPGRGHRVGRRDSRRRCATGLGAKPKAGLTGFTVSHLQDTGLPAALGKSDFPHPDRMATPLEIMIEGPIGGAAFNNEFGRPNLLRLLPHLRVRVRPSLPANEIRGYHKPIMIAGGVGNVREEHALKQDRRTGGREASSRSGVARPCSSGLAAARRRAWPAALQQRGPGLRIGAAGQSRRCSGVRRKSSTAAGRWVRKTRYC